jgi:hypothetical protein
MYCDYQHYLPPTPAMHDAEHDALSDHEATPCVLDASHAQNLTAHALHRPGRPTTPIPSAPGPRAPHIRQAAGAAVPRRARCPRKSDGAATIFAPQRSPRPPLHAPQLGCTTPPPCATPATFIPHAICRFPHLQPACDDDLRLSPILPLDAYPSRAALTAICTTTCVRNTRGRFSSSPSRATMINTSPFRFGPPSMQEHPCMLDAPPAHSGSLTRRATGMRSVRCRPHL